MLDVKCYRFMVIFLLKFIAYKVEYYRHWSKLIKSVLKEHYDVLLV